LSDHISSYGIVVDKFLGEKELVLQEFDTRLGKIPDISSGALLEDGMPVLIVDVDDMVRSIDNILTRGRLQKLTYSAEEAGVARYKKRVLVIDDSITVREVECRLLQNQGYDVQSAVNGVDGWNALRMSNYDLVVTDVDMPRMNGIELVRLIRADPKLHNLPIMIVSYKERDEDRLLGLEAGANYYLTKSSFHDETLVNAVLDLIGEP
jgi:two-component system sensor histidine kinase and response regulator WspE